MAEQQGTTEQAETTEAPDAADSGGASRWAEILEEAGGADTEDDDDDESDDDSDEFSETPAAVTPDPKAAAAKKKAEVEKKRWADLEKPTPAKIAIRERIAQREGQLQAQQTTAQLQAQLEAERNRVAQLTTQQQQADAQFRELVQAGKVDEALKVKGVSATVGELSRALLQAKGGLPAGGKDPRVDQLEKQLQTFVSAEQQRIQQAQQAQAELERRQIEEQDIKDLTEEIAALPYEGADALAQFPRFSEYVYQGVRQGRDTEEVVRDMRESYQKVFHDLCKAALAGAFEFPPEVQLAAGSRPAPKAGVRQVVPPRGGAKAPRAALPDELRHHGRARWDAILKGKL
jgi:hypothetical protein